MLPNAFPKAGISLFTGGKERIVEFRKEKFRK